MQPLCEYDDEVFEEIKEKEIPVEGVCFWVLTEFNIAHRAVKRRFKNPDDVAMEPDSYGTYAEAMDMADEYAVEIRNKFRNSCIETISDDYREDEYHIYIVDKTNNPIAKIGVVAEDYRKKTRH